MRFPQEAYDHEKPRAVFLALVATLDEKDQEDWKQRWREAENAEQTMRDYNRSYDDSLLGVTRFGQ